MKSLFLVIQILFFSINVIYASIIKSNLIFVPDSSSIKSEFFIKGIESLSNKDTLNAEKYFKKSIDQYDDGPSYFELAKINLKKNTILSRLRAYEYLKTSLWREPLNISYRFEFASLSKIYSKITAANEFKKIISIDSAHVKSWIALAQLKDDEFAEYNNSVRKMSDEFYGSLQEYADEDFYQAEYYYKKALSIDSNNYDANFNLSLLYEKAGRPCLGIPFLKQLINEKKEDKNVHLCLGLLYYKTKRTKECYEEYKQALRLMSDEERLDFTFNSVKFLIEPAFNDIVEKLSDNELKDFIELYWKYFDPLYLTDFNERLLEHYSRVAFANLHFSVPQMGKVGWKTDRGEVVVRYGEPLNFLRIRPSMGDIGVNMKTEVWNYSDMTLGFTDMASSGNYLFSAPPGEREKLVSQFSSNTLFYMEYLRKARHTLYEPTFEGPKIEIPYSIAQFKSKTKRNNTDLYINYLVETPDSLFKDNIKSISYDEGFFFFAKNVEERFRNVSKFSIRESSGELSNRFINYSMQPDSGFASFELVRDIDKATSTNRFDLKIKKFSNLRLDISDLLLADFVGREESHKSTFTRNDLNILSNPKQIFSNSYQPFLYYEIYNLKKGENGLTDFEQSISLTEYVEKPKDALAKATNNVLEFFGIGKQEVVTLTSNYQTIETDTEIFFQLDLSKYTPGKYLITVTIKDRIQNHEIKTESIFEWKN